MVAKKERIDINSQIRKLTKEIDKEISKEKDEFTKESLKAIKKFIKKPDEITISISPQKPVPLGRLQRLDDTKEIIKLLNAKVNISAFADFVYLPDFASLNKFLSKSVDSVFYKESIVFFRDGNLWVMDSDGKNQRQLTKEGVGEWSVSRNGKIVFDRFDLYRHYGEDIKDLNIYYIDSVKDGEIKRLTRDNKSRTPLISPDGKKVVFQKFIWGGETYRGSGEGIWIMDLESGKQKELVGVVQIPDEIRKERNKFALVKGEMDEKRWHVDKFIWSPDSKTIVFARDYEPGGNVSYITEIDERQVSALPKKIIRILDLHGNKLLNGDCCINYNLTLYDIDLNTTNVLVRNALIETAKFSPDGKYITYYTPPDSTGLEGLWFMESDGKERRKIIDTFNASYGVSFSNDAQKILFTKYNSNITRYNPKLGENIGQDEIWIFNIDGSILKKFVDNALSPKWTTVARITFISPVMTKTIILITTSVVGILLLLSIVLVAKKAIKAVITGIKSCF
jgi:Tol biopolymer transport system component